MGISKKYLLLILFIFLYLVPINAQVINIDRQKAVLIYKIIENVMWPDDYEMDYVLIATVNSSSGMLKELKRNKPNSFAIGIDFEIKNFKSVSEINENLQYFPRVIYLENSTKEEVDYVLETIEFISTLLITDSYETKMRLMTNLFVDRNTFEVNFEYNIKNIMKQHIAVPDKFLEIGGEDLAFIVLDETQTDLKQKEDILEKKEEELLLMNKKIKQQKESMELILQNLLINQRKLEENSEKLSEIEQKAIAQQQQIFKQNKIINNKKKEVSLQKENLKKYKNKMLQQIAKFENQTEKIEMQKKIADRYAREIKNKKDEFKQLNFVIKTQRYALIIFIIFIIVVVILLFLLFKNFIEKKKQNVLLEQKNIKIESQSEELKNINVELEKLSIVAENTDNAVIIADSKGEIEWVNSGFERLYGASLSDFVKKRGSNLISSSLDIKILEKIEKNLILKKSVTFSSQIITPKNNKLWLQTSLTPMFDDSGNLIKLLSLESDITETKQAEEKIVRQHKNITMSIRYARRIQEAVLPSSEYINSLNLNTFILYKPRDIVSGDFYWFAEVEDKILFTAADCSGHGVPGAFMSMLGIAFLNEITGNLSKTEIRPDHILNELRIKIKKYLRQSQDGSAAVDGLDMVLCMLDKNKKELHYAGAFNPLIIISDNKLKQINADRMPIGIYLREKSSFTNHIIKYKKDDVIYLLTDGYQDQFNEESTSKFMRANLKEILFNMHKDPLERQKSILEQTITDWQGNARQIDDILIMGVRL